MRNTITAGGLRITAQLTPIRSVVTAGQVEAQRVLLRAAMSAQGTIDVEAHTDENFRAFWFGYIQILTTGARNWYYRQGNEQRYERKETRRAVLDGAATMQFPWAVMPQRILQGTHLDLNFADSPQMPCDLSNADDHPLVRTGGTDKFSLYLAMHDGDELVVLASIGWSVGWRARVDIPGRAVNCRENLLSIDAVQDEALIHSVDPNMRANNNAAHMFSEGRWT